MQGEWPKHVLDLYVLRIFRFYHGRQSLRCFCPFLRSRPWVREADKGRAPLRILHRSVTPSKGNHDSGKQLVEEGPESLRTGAAPLEGHSTPGTATLFPRLIVSHEERSHRGRVVKIRWQPEMWQEGSQARVQKPQGKNYRLCRKKVASSGEATLHPQEREAGLPGQLSY